MFRNPIQKFASLTHVRQASFASLLKKRLNETLPVMQTKLKDLKKSHSNLELQKITLDQAIGGMRDIIGLFHETSHLDPRTGITFKGYSIQEVTEFLPKAKDGPEGEGDEPLPEALLWLMMTGEIPNHQEIENLQQELRDRSTISDSLVNFIRNLSPQMHPMTQLSMSLLYLQTDSVFAKAYKDGVHKSQYWEYTYEDAMNLLAKIPKIAALIYRHTYRNNEFVDCDPKLDWAGNYAHMLGYTQFEFRELIRGYLTIHSDHEGGNVSAHTSHLVGSALSDPYLAYASGLNGLAGPLHGLANQEVLKYLLGMRQEIGDRPSDEKIKEYTINMLSSGKVVPGYGHAVLRHTDPRFLHQKLFAEKHIQGDSLIWLVKRCYRVIPGILRSLGKVKNPWPNVDAHSGVLLYHYGLTEFDYYTVVFGVSRSLGCMANLIISRALGLPIERPNSIDTTWIESKFKKGGTSLDV